MLCCCLRLLTSPGHRVQLRPALQCAFESLCPTPHTRSSRDFREQAALITRPVTLLSCLACPPGLLPVIQKSSNIPARGSLSLPSLFASLHSHRPLVHNYREASQSTGDVAWSPSDPRADGSSCQCVCLGPSQKGGRSWEESGVTRRG